MQLHKEWASFRITLLLYMVVLVLPLGFYFVHTSFKTLQADTQAVRQSSGLVTTLSQQNPQPDAFLKGISKWVDKQDATTLYIGAKSLSEDFSELKTCTSQGSTCIPLAENLAVNIEKMVYLKQKKIVNYYYAALALVMMLVLLMIYFVRVYIHKQMKKHAIHDHETHLFNQKYFLAELHSTFDRSLRYEYPLSLISVTLNGFTDKTYDKKTKSKLMQELGGVFTSVTRNSDIASRYNEGHIVVLLPLTDKEHALILESRLKEALEDHNFNVTPKMEFSFETVEADAQESEEAFIARIL